MPSKINPNTLADLTRPNPTFEKRQILEITTFTDWGSHIHTSVNSYMNV